MGINLLFSFLIGLAFSILISLLAYWKGSLSPSGAKAAILVGTIIYFWGSLFWYGLLLVFFISSSLLSHYGKLRKHKVEDLFAKTGKRDAWQVMANGGIGAVLVVLAAFSQNPIPYKMIYLGVMATVTADTWGTELGVLAKNRPRSILTGKRVEPGTSGGISGLGMISAMGGAALIGLCGALFEGGHPIISFLFIGIVSGTLGAMADSLLGATLQSMYFCRTCQKETEKIYHCGLKTEQRRGYTWCTNDVVNMASSLAGGGFACLLYYLCR
jgi:uncharacterized protein (TIGR00297 family)